MGVTSICHSLLGTGLAALDRWYDLPAHDLDLAQRPLLVHTRPLQPEDQVVDGPVLRRNAVSPVPLDRGSPNRNRSMARSGNGTEKLSSPGIALSWPQRRKPNTFPPGTAGPPSRPSPGPAPGKAPASWVEPGGPVDSPGPTPCGTGQAAWPTPGTVAWGFTNHG